MHQLDTTYTRYQLTQREELEGAVLNNFQVALLSNDLCSLAELYLGIELDLTHPRPLEDLISRQQYTKGKMDCIRALLDANISAQITLNEIAKQEGN